jgi:hypothetical protein
MLNLKQEHSHHIIGFGLTALVIIAGGTYGYLRMNALSARIDAQSENLKSLATIMASTTSALQTAINQTGTTLSDALNNQQHNLGTIQQQLGGFQNQVGGLTGTLNNIQKLSQIDPELLKKYSKVYFLNENYVPQHLAEVPLNYQYSSSKQLLFYTDALPKLESMINDASATGVKLFVDSAYRSFAEQKALKGLWCRYRKFILCRPGIFRASAGYGCGYDHDRPWWSARWIRRDGGF